jgi:hypothetical protein
MTQHAVWFCDGCGNVRDECGELSLGHACWIALHTYMVKYGLTWDDVTFTHTYCPECAAFLQRAARRKPMSEAEVLS